MKLKFLENLINNFLNELPPIFLGVVHFWDKLATMGVSSRTGVKYVIYKKADKRDIAKCRPLLLLNLDYKIYTSLLKNNMQKP